MAISATVPLDTQAQYISYGDQYQLQTCLHSVSNGLINLYLQYLQYILIM